MRAIRLDSCAKPGRPVRQPEVRDDGTGAPRIEELDGLRGVAVLMVVAWHYLGATLDPTLGFWAKATARTLILGRTGVDLFFVLSGFLITGIILARTRPAIGFLGSFYLRRALRILPPYLILVAVFWLIVATGASNPAFNADTPWWRHLSFTQNLWMSENARWGPDAISVTWSVAIEEQFYLVFPLLMLLLPRRAVPAMLVAAALASITWRAWVYAGPQTAFTAYVSTLARLDALAFGGVLAWAWREPRARAWLESKRRALFLVTVACLALTPALAVLIARDLSWHMFSWAHTYLSLFYSAVLVCVLLASGTRFASLLRAKWLGFVGGISYSVYLFHPFMLSCAFLIAGRTEHVRNWSDAAIVLAALVATLAWCTLSSRGIEKPAIRFGRRFAY